jgi:hypothetical protein
MLVTTVPATEDTSTWALGIQLGMLVATIVAAGLAWCRAARAGQAEKAARLSAEKAAKEAEEANIYRRDTALSLREVASITTEQLAKLSVHPINKAIDLNRILELNRWYEDNDDIDVELAWFTNEASTKVTLGTPSVVLYDQTGVLFTLSSREGGIWARYVRNPASFPREYNRKPTIAIDPAESAFVCLGFVFPLDRRDLTRLRRIVVRVPVSPKLQNGGEAIEFWIPVLPLEEGRGKSGNIGGA